MQEVGGSYQPPFRREDPPSANRGGDRRVILEATLKVDIVVTRGNPVVLVKNNKEVDIVVTKVVLLIVQHLEVVIKEVIVMKVLGTVVEAVVPALMLLVITFLPPLLVLLVKVLGKVFRSNPSNNELPSLGPPPEYEGRPDPNFEWLPRNPAVEQELFGQAHVKSGINFDKYEAIPVSTIGNDCPKEITTFEDSDLHPLVKDNLKLAQYSSPTPVQKYSIPIVTAGRDLMACAQTGSGKTAAFLFPILSQTFRHGVAPRRKNFYAQTAYPTALILAPTRELAMQIYEEARKFCYRSWVIPQVCYGGQPINNQVRELSRGCDLLVATPGRLVDLMNNRSRVSLSHGQIFGP